MYENVLGEQFEFYCEVCGNYAHEVCDCCTECLEVADLCECN